MLNTALADDAMCQMQGLDQCPAHSRPIEACADQVAGTIPDPKPNEIQICHSNYFTVANTVTKTPDWTAYLLSANRVPPKRNPNRSEYFCPDPCLQTGQRSELNDYIGLSPSYNRGHMMPAIDNKWDLNAYKEAFFLSNILPQDPKNNGGIWDILENDVDAWQNTHGDLYVIAGPIYDYNGVQHNVVGVDNVWAPAALFKIIYSKSTNDVISFIIPNKDIPADQLSDYLTSINNINQLTGLNLFPDLADNLKSKIPTELWK